MTRDRLRAYWLATVMVVTLAGVVLLVRLLAPNTGDWVSLILMVAFLLLGTLTMFGYRPRPWTPEWTSPARERGGLTAIANNEPIATPAQRAAALDQARRQVWLPVQQVTVWSIQAVVWSGFAWSPQWLRVLCLVTVVAEVYVLRRIRHRITRIDHYDDTVPTVDAPPAHPKTP